MCLFYMPRWRIAIGVTKTRRKHADWLLTSQARALQGQLQARRPLVRRAVQLLQRESDHDGPHCWCTSPYVHSFCIILVDTSIGLCLHILLCTTNPTVHLVLHSLLFMASSVRTLPKCRLHDGVISDSYISQSSSF